jgi:hypothetical protein
MDNRLIESGFSGNLEPLISMKADHIIRPLIESNLKLFSFFYKKNPQVAFFPSLYREVFLNTYLKGVFFNLSATQITV